MSGTPLTRHIRLVRGDAAGTSERTTARDLRARVMERLDAWNSLLDRHPAQARQTVIRPLLEGRIILTPRREPAGRFYEFAAPLWYGALVSGLVALPIRVVTVVPPG